MEIPQLLSMEITGENGIAVVEGDEKYDEGFKLMKSTLDTCWAVGVCLEEVVSGGASE